MAVTIIVVNILAMLQLYFIFGITPCSLAVFIMRLGLMLGCAYLTTLFFTYTEVVSTFYHIGITSIIIFLLFPFLLYVSEGFSESDRMVLKLAAMKTKRLINRADTK